MPVDSLDSDEDGVIDTGLDSQTPQYFLLKYADASASVVVADGIEARLIEAEAQLQTNNFTGMRATLDALRGTIGMPNLPTVSTRDAAIDMLFSERAFWLYATGHRLGDMRRLIRQYLRPADAVFPTGDYHKGGGVYWPRCEPADSHRGAEQPERRDVHGQKRLEGERASRTNGR